MNLPHIYLYAGPAFTACVVLEILVWRFWRKTSYEMRDTTTNLIAGFLYAKAQRYVFIVGGLVWVQAYRHRLFEIPNTLWALGLCFVVSDFAYYWYHRIAHERRFFWATHVMHHSSQHMNLSVALRLPWTNLLTFLFIFWVPVAWIGFSPRMIMYFITLNLIYQFWLHTELIPKLGPIEWIFNTPSHHRVHHGRTPRYVDANYGGVFIIWDRLFGTLVVEDAAEPVEYGLVKNLGTFNPLRVAFHEWMAMGRDLWHAHGVRERFMYVFGRPGWSPDGSRKTTAMLRAEWRARLAEQPAA